MLDLPNKKFKLIKPVTLLNGSNHPQFSSLNKHYNENVITTQSISKEKEFIKSPISPKFILESGNKNKFEKGITYTMKNSVERITGNLFNKRFDEEKFNKDGEQRVLKVSKSTATEIRITSPKSNQKSRNRIKNISYPDIITKKASDTEHRLTVSKNVTPKNSSVKNKLTKNFNNKNNTEINSIFEASDYVNSVSNEDNKIIIKKMEYSLPSKIKINNNNDNKMKILTPTFKSVSAQIVETANVADFNDRWSVTSNFYAHIYNSKYKNFTSAKYSDKPNGCIEGYSANTYQGIVRNYNEDRVTIILNVIQPNSRKDEVWPKVSFFGIYDGHGGNKCADFLKENLHQFIFREKCFPSDPLQAIYKGFEEVEKHFILKHKPINVINDYDRSGSCAIIVIIMNDICYVANLGDSRALLSEQGSSKIYQLTRDHKPNDLEEKKRVESAGGYIYQSQNMSQLRIQMINSPWRIFPGRLSVSRSFGDIEAKFPELGGNPKVLLARPSEVKFKLIILGDGIFDKYSNLEILKTIWASTNKSIITNNINQNCGRIVDLVMKTSLFKTTLDNITCIFICFNNFKQIISNLQEDALSSVFKDISNECKYKIDEKIRFQSQELNSSDSDEDIKASKPNDNYEIDYDVYRISQVKNAQNVTTNNVGLKVSGNFPTFKLESQYDYSNNQYGSNKSLDKVINSTNKNSNNVVNFNSNNTDIFSRNISVNNLLSPMNNNSITKLKFKR